MEKLENCELKIGTHQYNYIGGAIHIKKKVSDDYTTYQEEEVKVAEKSRMCSTAQTAGKITTLTKMTGRLVDQDKT